MLALIDGDIILYRCGFAAEKTVYHISIEGEVVHTTSSKRLVKDFLEENKLSEEEVEITKETRAEPLENCLHNAKAVLMRYI